MSYEDLSEARAKRAAKEKATASKGKRDRKCKSPAPEAGSPEPRAKVARIRVMKSSSGADGLGQCWSSRSAYAYI